MIKCKRILSMLIILPEKTCARTRTKRFADDSLLKTASSSQTLTQSSSSSKSRIGGLGSSIGGAISSAGEAATSMLPPVIKKLLPLMEATVKTIEEIAESGGEIDKMLEAIHDNFQKVESLPKMIGKFFISFFLFY